MPLFAVNKPAVSTNQYTVKPTRNAVTIFGTSQFHANLNKVIVRLLIVHFRCISISRLIVGITDLWVACTLSKARGFS